MEFLYFHLSKKRYFLQWILLKNAFSFSFYFVLLAMAKWKVNRNAMQ